MKPYDRSQPLISIHMPKCGGNSLGLLLGALFGENLRYHYPDEKAGSLPQKHRAGPGSCIHGHFDNTRGMGVSDYYPGVGQFITFLRDPFDLKVSLYFYLKMLRKNHAAWFNGMPVDPAETDVNAFLRNRIDAESDYPTFRDFLPGDITPDNYEDVLSRHFVYIGIMEDAPMSAGVLAHRLGCVPIRMGRQNAGIRDEVVSEDIREAFILGHALDYAIYRYALKHYRDPGLPGRYMRSTAFLQQNPLEPRCGLCRHYRICSEQGRIPDCDRGLGFSRDLAAERRFPGKWFKEVCRQWRGSGRNGEMPDRFSHLERLADEGGTLRPWIAWPLGAPPVHRLDFTWPDSERAASFWPPALPPALGEGEPTRWLAEEMRLCRYDGVRSVSVGLPLDPKAGFRFILDLAPETAGEKEELLACLGLSSAFKAIGHRAASLCRLEICHGARGILWVDLHVRLAKIYLTGKEGGPLGKTPWMRDLTRRLILQGRRRLRLPCLVYSMTREGRPPDNTPRPPDALHLPLLENGIDWDFLHEGFRAADGPLDLSVYHRLRYHLNVVERALTMSLNSGKNPKEQALCLHYQVWSPKAASGTDTQEERAMGEKNL